MFFFEPQPTQYDLHFMIGHVPVRVHPLFWIVAVLMGASDPTPMHMALWVIAVFVSILVHELGHVLAFQFYGIRSHVVLHSMGGLAVPDSMSYGHGRRLDWVAEVVIAFAGPAAGFLLAAVVCAVVIAAGGDIVIGRLLPWLPFPVPRGIRSEPMLILTWDMLQLNIFWGFVNLLPIFPLDGGRISAAVLSAINPADGRRQALVLSIVVAIAAAALVFVEMKDQQFLAIFFAFMAYNNYQILQAMGGGRGGWR